MVMNLATVAVEFEGGLVFRSPQARGPGALLSWRRGALEFLRAAAASGIRIILHTSCAAWQLPVLPGDAEEFFRTGRAPADLEVAWAYYDEMRTWLQARGAWGLVEVWSAPGKPVADRYLDARGEKADWVQVGMELGMRFG
jgi:hypothetical protein